MVEEGGSASPAVLSKNIPSPTETFLQHLFRGTFATRLRLSACKRYCYSWKAPPHVLSVTHRGGFPELSPPCTPEAGSVPVYSPRRGWPRATKEWGPLSHLRKALWDPRTQIVGPKFLSSGELNEWQCKFKRNICLNPLVLYSETGF